VVTRKKALLQRNTDGLARCLISRVIPPLVLTDLNQYQYSSYVSVKKFTKNIPTCVALFHEENSSGKARTNIKKLVVAIRLAGRLKMPLLNKIISY